MVEVGRVYVTVLPAIDSSFSRKIKEVAKRIPPVVVDVDTSLATRKLERLTKTRYARIIALVDTRQAEKDLRNLQAARKIKLTAEVEELSNLTDKTIKVKVESDNDLSNLTDPNLNYKISVDREHFRNQLRDLNRDIEEHLKVQLQFFGAAAAIRTVWADVLLAAASMPPIPLRFVVDSSAINDIETSVRLAETEIRKDPVALRIVGNIDKRSIQAQTDRVLRNIEAVLDVVIDPDKKTVAMVKALKEEAESVANPVGLRTEVDKSSAAKASAIIGSLARDRTAKIKMNVDGSVLSKVSKSLGAVFESLTGGSKIISGFSSAFKSFFESIETAVGAVKNLGSAFSAFLDIVKAGTSQVKGISSAISGVETAAGGMAAALGEAAATAGISLAIGAVVAVIMALVGALTFGATAAIGFMAAAVATAAVVTTLALAFGALASALVIIPGLITGILGPLGVLAAALMPVIKAFQAFISLTDAQGKASAKAALGGSAQSASNSRLASSTSAVASAQRNLLSAMKGVEKARETAKRQIEDLAQASVDGALSEERAVIELERAREEYNKAITDPQASATDEKMAELAVREAENNLNRIRKGNRRNAEDLAEAQKKGIEGSDAVVAAQMAVLSAQEAVANATNNTASAYDSLGSAADGTATQLADFNSQVEALTGPGKALLDVLKEGYAIFTQVSNILQESALGGVTETVKSFLALFGQVNAETGKFVEGPLLPGVKAIAVAVSELGSELSNLLQQPGVRDNLTSLLSSAAQATKELGSAGLAILVSLLDSLAKVAKSAEPAVAAFSDGLKKMAPVLAGFFAAISTPEVIDAIVVGMQAFFQIITTIMPVISTLVAELTKIGSVALGQMIGAIVDIFTVFGQIITDLANSGMIAGFIEVLNAVGDALVALAQPGEDGKSTFTLLGDAFGSVMKALAPMIPMLVEQLIPELPSLIKSFEDLSKEFIKMLPTLIEMTPLFMEMLRLTLELARVAMPLLTLAMTLISPIMSLVMMELNQFIWVLNLIITTAQKVWDFLFGNSIFPDLLEAFTGWISSIKGLFSGLWEFFRNGFGSAKDWIVSTWESLVGWFAGLPGRMSNLFSGMWDGIKGAFKAALNWIIEKWNSFSLEVNIPDAIPGLPDKFKIDTPDIPLLAAGGLVSAATLAVVGEAGPEAIVPLDQLGAFMNQIRGVSETPHGSGDSNIVLNYTVNNPVAEPASRSIPKDMRRIASVLG